MPSFTSANSYAGAAVKALSILQPWAEVILAGWKDVENRVWRNSFRGEFLIHAGKKYDTESEGFILKALIELGRLRGHEVENYLYAMRNAPRGAILGRARITTCVTPLLVPGNPWALGPWCYLLSDIKRFEFPQPYRGALGFFEVDHRA